MKQIFFTLTLMASVLCCSAQGQVNFFEGTWEEAFAKAAEEDKHVFVDSYTDWCYWCKVMDKETFTDKAIADYLNEEFVAIKVNMEKGFGTSVAMKFRVRAFPTLLFFNPQGQILEKKPGFTKDKSKFLAHLQEIRADKRPQVFSFASQNFDLDYPEFVEGSFGVGGKRVRTKAETVDAWLDETEDLYSEVAWTALTQCPTGEKYKQHLLDNADKYIGLYGTQEFDGFVSQMVYSKVSKAGKEGDKKMLDEAIALLTKHYTDEEDKAGMIDNFEMSYMKATKDWKGYTMKADKLIREGTLEENAGLANSVAWTLYEKCDDPKCLKMMEEWMNKVVELEPNYMFLDTYAALLYKNGDMPKAKKYAEQAIVVGKKDESDVKETETLLQKIEESMEDGQ
jgi:thioredoxin-related protein